MSLFDRLADAIAKALVRAAARAGSSETIPDLLAVNAAMRRGDMEDAHIRSLEKQLAGVRAAVADLTRERDEAVERSARQSIESWIALRNPRDAAFLSRLSLRTVQAIRAAGFSTKDAVLSMTNEEAARSLGVDAAADLWFFREIHPAGS